MADIAMTTVPADEPGPDDGKSEVSLVMARCFLCGKPDRLVAVKHRPDAMDTSEFHHVYIHGWYCYACNKKLQQRSHVFFIPVDDDWDGGPNWRRAGHFGHAVHVTNLDKLGLPQEQVDTLKENQVCLVTVSTWEHMKLPLPPGMIFVTEEAKDPETKEEKK